MHYDTCQFITEKIIFILTVSNFIEIFDKFIIHLKIYGILLRYIKLFLNYKHVKLKKNGAKTKIKFF